MNNQTALEVGWLNFRKERKMNKMEIMEIFKGSFLEGEKVTVNIDGNIITRKVYWSGYAKDLYIVYKNARYFYCEFWNR